MPAKPAGWLLVNRDEGPAFEAPCGSTIFQKRRRSAANLRSHLTPEESYLWSFLQRRQLRGRKFRRQHGVGPYILDFYCPSEKLAVELDGSTHDHEDAQAYDMKRGEFLKQLGIRTLRFQNQDVRKNIEGVLIAIEEVFTA